MQSRRSCLAWQCGALQWPHGRQKRRGEREWHLLRDRSACPFCLRCATGGVEDTVDEAATVDTGLVVGLVFSIVLVSVALATHGCGGNVGIEPEPCGVSGGPAPARLEPVVAHAEGLPLAVVPGLYLDTLRGEACTFTRTPTGSFCLPRFVWHSKPGWFADASCTQPLAIVDACAELPRYARDNTAAQWPACEPYALEALFPLGEPLPVGAPLYALASGACALTGEVDATNAALPIGAPVPLTEFVEGTHVPGVYW